MVHLSIAQRLSKYIHRGERLYQKLLKVDELEAEVLQVDIDYAKKVLKLNDRAGMCIALDRLIIAV